MIEVKNLTKRYGSNTAVSDLSFTIESGHIYGFLGPNGAGKSTTMNIITGCLAATSGDVKINGFDIFEQPDQAKRHIGYLPEIPPLYVDQTPREYLEFVAAAKGISRSARVSEINKVIAAASIEDVADRLIKNLSKGYRQRVGIAQALLGDPEIIILDEPTVGLDPMQIIEIRDLIRSLGSRHTVILSSHILAEVQSICDEVLIIHKGKLIAFDKPENLEKTLSGSNKIELCSDITRDELEELLASAQITVESIEEPEGSGHNRFDITMESQDLVSACGSIFSAFAAAGKVLYTLNPVHASLEDIYIRLTASTDEAEADVEEAEPAAVSPDEDTDSAPSEPEKEVNE